MGVRTDRRPPGQGNATTVGRVLLAALVVVGVAACGGGGGSASGKHTSSTTGPSTGGAAGSGGATGSGGAGSAGGGSGSGTAPQLVQASVSPSAVLHCLPSKKGVVTVTVSWSSVHASFVTIYRPDGSKDLDLPTSGSRSETIPCDGTSKTFVVFAIRPGDTSGTNHLKYVTVSEALIKTNTGTVPTLPKPLPTSASSTT